MPSLSRRNNGTVVGRGGIGDIDCVPPPVYLRIYDYLLQTSTFRAILRESARFVIAYVCGLKFSRDHPYLELPLLNLESQV